MSAYSWQQLSFPAIPQEGFINPVFICNLSTSTWLQSESRYLLYLKVSLAFIQWVPSDNRSLFNLLFKASRIWSPRCESWLSQNPIVQPISVSPHPRYNRHRRSHASPCHAHTTHRQLLIDESGAWVKHRINQGQFGYCLLTSWNLRDLPTWTINYWEEFTLKWKIIGWLMGESFCWYQAMWHLGGLRESFLRRLCRRYRTLVLRGGPARHNDLYKNKQGHRLKSHLRP